MVSESFLLIIHNSIFSDNWATPLAAHLMALPLTLSGVGGAIFSQSASLTIINCKFIENFVLTGEFDAGSVGGAIALENSFPVVIKSTIFQGNGAPGFFSSSSFSQPGSGGALYVKFSAVNMSDDCIFEKNWASSGGAAPAIGGAVAGNKR